MELNGAGDLDIFKGLEYSENSKKLATILWYRTRRIKDHEERSRLYDQMYEKREDPESIIRLKMGEFELPYHSLNVESLSELIRIVNNIPSVPEKSSEFDYFVFRKSLFGYDDSKAILTRFKSALQDYVERVYRLSLERKDEITAELSALKRENERLLGRTFKGRVKKIRNWLRKHKLISAIIGISTLVGALVRILMFFGIDYRVFIAFIKSLLCRR